jgi:hypothetical protein
MDWTRDSTLFKAKRRDVVQYFVAHHQQLVNLHFLTIWLECLNPPQMKWVTRKEKYRNGNDGLV